MSECITAREPDAWRWPHIGEDRTCITVPGVVNFCSQPETHVERDTPLWLVSNDDLAARDEVVRREVQADALREAADNLYLSTEGQHNAAARVWLHRRANLIDPRTRASVCEHGNSKGYCGFCSEAGR